MRRWFYDLGDTKYPGMVQIHKRKQFGLVAGTRDMMVAAARQAHQRWWKGIREVEKVFLKRDRPDVAMV